MPGPLSGVRFIHTAIRREAADIEARANAGGDVAAAATFLSHIVDLHTRGEEASIFEALEERVPGIAPAYLLDHEIERALFAELQAGRDVQRNAVVLAQHCALHIRKEEELLLPFMEKAFTPPEQGALVGRLMAVFTPADMAELLPWIVTRLDVPDRIFYVGMLGQVLPPPAHEKVIGMLKATLAPDVRATVPALA